MHELIPNDHYFYGKILPVRQSFSVLCRYVGLLSLVFVLSLLGCEPKTKIDYLHFSFTNMKTIPINTPIRYCSPHRNYENDNLTTFTISSPNNLYIFDWNTGLMADTIFLSNVSNGKYLRQKNYINRDTILIGFFENSIFGWQENDIYIIDASLRLVDSLPFDDYVVYQESVVEPEKSLTVYFSSIYSKLEYSERKVFGTVVPYNFSFGDSIYRDHNFRPKFAGHWQNQDGSYVFKGHSVLFPDWVYTQPYVCSSSSAMRRAINHKGNPVYSFEMTPEYVEYDMTSGETRSYRVPSAFLDTVRPVPLDENGKPEFKSQFNPREGSFFQFYFDPWRQQYIRLIKLPPDSSKGPEGINVWRYALGIIDTNFNLIGEGILPEAMQPKLETTNWPRMVIRPDGLYFYDHPATEAANANGEKGLVYARLDWTVTGKNIYADYFERRKKNREGKAAPKAGDRLAAYLKEQHGVGTENQLVMLLPLQEACPYCRGFVLDFYKQFRAEHPDKPFYLVAVASDTSVTNELLFRKHGLAPGDPYLITDPRNDLKRYAAKFINPRLLIYKDGKKQTDQNLPPAEVESVPGTISRYFGVELKDNPHEPQK